MTLLPWQQKFCDDQMYFILDHPYAKFHSNDLYYMGDRSFKF